MELVTHTLSGIVLSRAFLAPTQGQASVWAFTLGTVFPDIESFIALQSFGAYLRYHRGLSHSFLFAPVLAMLQTLLLKPVFRESRFIDLLLASLGGVIFHLLLDFANSYGTQLFLPLTHYHYALDLDIILDLLILIPLVLAAIFQTFFPGSSFKAGIATLAFCILVFLGRAFLRSNAERFVQGNIVGTIPGAGTVYNPLNWKVIEKIPEGFSVHEVHSLSGVISSSNRPSLDREVIETMVASSSLGSSFLYWSRFPCFQKEPLEEGFRLVGTDLRFDPTDGGHGWKLSIFFDREGRYLRDEMDLGR